MDWITRNIAIGKFIDAKNADPKRIDAILCLIDDCCSEDNPIIDIVSAPLLGGAGNDKRVIKDCLDFIDDVVSANEKILVHCHAGRSRSVCIVARYFMKKERMKSHEALAIIETKREIYLSPGIEELLEY